MGGWGIPGKISWESSAWKSTGKVTEKGTRTIPCKSTLLAVLAICAENPTMVDSLGDTGSVGGI